MQLRNVESIPCLHFDDDGKVQTYIYINNLYTTELGMILNEEKADYRRLEQCWGMAGANFSNK